MSQINTVNEVIPIERIIKIKYSLNCPNQCSNKFNFDKCQNNIDEF